MPTHNRAGTVSKPPPPATESTKPASIAISDSKPIDSKVKISKIEDRS